MHRKSIEAAQQLQDVDGEQENCPTDKNGNSGPHETSSSQPEENESSENIEKSNEKFQQVYFCIVRVATVKISKSFF